MQQHKKTYFGAQEVDHNAKTGLVKQVFSAVAPAYDCMNQLMSFGLHRQWKQAMVREIIPGSLLDLASGTGDIARLYAARLASLQRRAPIFATDINPDMLYAGRDKLINANLWQDMHYAIANAEALPFASESMDNCTIAFGIRNVTDIPAALAEMHRVLVLGGKVIILEFAKVDWPWLARLYAAYSTHIIPKMGKYVANNEAAYRYLVESIERFPGQMDFVQLLQQAGFTRVNYHNMTGGVVAIYTGWKSSA